MCSGSRFEGTLLNKTGRKKLGEILVDAGILEPEILAEALKRQRGTSKRLGQILEEMDVILEEDIAAALGRQFGVQQVKGIARHSFPPALLKLITPEDALKRFIFPLKIEKKTLYLAMVNPLDLDTAQEIGFRNNLQVIPCVTTPEEIKAAVHRHMLAATSAKLKTERSWTVLVVDDQEMIQLAIEAALKREGIVAYKASNGAEGLTLAMKEHPHLIISDTLMPRMNGVEMFRNLKGNTATAEIPVIALSSKADAEEEARLLEIGYFDFIAKPINSTRILARVKRALRYCYGEKPPRQT
jgi:PleD family two-component response regulator